MRIKAIELNWKNQSDYCVSKGCVIEFHIPPGYQGYIMIEIMTGYITSRALSDRRRTYREGNIMKLPYEIFERAILNHNRKQDSETKSFSIFNSISCP